VALNAGGARMTVAPLMTNPLQELVLDAIDARTPLRIAGRSHWMNSGRPVEATRIASLAAHSGIVDYVPGDLTMTVRGGTTLAEIRDVTHAEGQWLPLEPYGTPDGTIGATIATASFGPLAHAFGRTRDLVLGVEFVTGDGKIVRGGGRVVKNVAGFDLVRLVTGSWGTLGIVTEATLRLYSQASQPTSVAMSFGDSPGALASRLTALSSAPITPFAAEIVSARAASAAGLRDGAAILVRFGGNEAAVAAHRAALQAIGGVTGIADETWSRLRTAEDAMPDAAVVRFSTLPARIATLWHSVAVACPEGMHFSTPRMGIVRSVVPEKQLAETISAAKASLPDCTIVYESIPHDSWRERSPSVIADRISSGIRRAFDPHGILNPGILGPVS
jgi:glycolate oxidase FAD binding subunit